jgi:aromatic ring-opening dioxygenase catalytic subunit (LigB family)
VCELSLLSSLRVKDHLHIAEALYELTQHGVLVIGSGFATHNLSRLGRTGAPTPRYVLEFKNWLNDVLQIQDTFQKKGNACFLTAKGPHRTCRLHMMVGSITSFHWWCAVQQQATDRQSSFTLRLFWKHVLMNIICFRRSDLPYKVSDDLIYHIKFPTIWSTI